MVWTTSTPLYKGCKFTYGEIYKSDTAIRNNIDNTPPEEVVKNAIVLAKKVLMPVREHFGIPFSPVSWFRCEKLERFINEKAYRDWCTKHGKKVNAASWAAYFALKSHPKGESVDFEIPGVDNDKLYQWILKNLEFDQLIREFPVKGDPASGWVHGSFSSVKNRKESFTIGAK